MLNWNTLEKYQVKGYPHWFTSEATSDYEEKK